jgi:hypothetical protein
MATSGMEIELQHDASFEFCMQNTLAQRGDDSKR